MELGGSSRTPAKRVGRPGRNRVPEEEGTPRTHGPTGCTNRHKRSSRRAPHRDWPRRILSRARQIEVFDFTYIFYDFKSNAQGAVQISTFTLSPPDVASAHGHSAPVRERPACENDAQGAVTRRSPDARHGGARLLRRPRRTGPSAHGGEHGIRTTDPPLRWRSCATDCPWPVAKRTVDFTDDPDFGCRLRPTTVGPLGYEFPWQRAA